jgi:hypothetical protein
MTASKTMAADCALKLVANDIHRQRASGKGQKSMLPSN